MPPPYVTEDRLRAAIAELHVDMVKWIIGTGLVVGLLAATIASIIVAAMGATDVEPADSPIVPTSDMEQRLRDIELALARQDLLEGTNDDEQEP